MYAYGENNRLEVAGELSCLISINETKTTAVFVVIKGHGRALLGYETTCKLGVLKIGQEYQAYGVINSETFDKQLFTGIGKLKNFQLKLSIDENCKPVAQPERRLPFKLRGDIEDQIKKLLEFDIIEKVHGPTPWVSPVTLTVKRSRDQGEKDCA